MSTRHPQTCRACGEHGHHAVDGQCSATYRALRWWDENGGTQVAAARRFGIARNTLAYAIKQRVLARRAAARERGAYQARRAP
jgi:hypothetical protein